MALRNSSDRLELIASLPVGPADDDVPDRPVAVILSHLPKNGFCLWLFLEVEIGQRQQQLGIGIAVQLQRAGGRLGRALVILLGHQDLALGVPRFRVLGFGGQDFIDLDEPFVIPVPRDADPGQREPSCAVVLQR